jgi:hypothetical protein
MQRLVTKQDLIDNPELIKRGVSVNQHWNFPEPSSAPVLMNNYEISEAQASVTDYGTPAKKAVKPTSKKSKSGK